MEKKRKNEKMKIMIHTQNPLRFPGFMLMEIGFCGNSLGLIMGEMCWDGIEQRGTWHETDGGYLWILVVWTLDLVASDTMLLTDTCTL